MATVIGPAGTLLYAEDLGGGIFMPVVKIHTGAVNVDGGPMTASNPLQFQGAALSITTFTSIPTAGQSIKTGAGIAYVVSIINTTGAAEFAQVFDATTTRPTATVPLQTSASTANNGQSQTTLGSIIYGIPFTNGLWLQMSTTLQTMTALAASTSTTGFILWK